MTSDSPIHIKPAASAGPPQDGEFPFGEQQAGTVAAPGQQPGVPDGAGTALSMERAPGRTVAGRGSWLLASAAQRMAAAAMVSAALWGLTAWAMGWW
jgi:hypothetical protein